MSLGAIQSTSQGIHFGLKQANKAAFEIARATNYPVTPPSVERPDQAEQLVKLKEAYLQVEANAKALKHSTDALGSIISTFA